MQELQTCRNGPVFMAQPCNVSSTWSADERMARHVTKLLTQNRAARTSTCATKDRAWLMMSNWRWKQDDIIKHVTWNCVGVIWGFKAQHQQRWAAACEGCTKLTMHLRWHCCCSCSTKFSFIVDADVVKLAIISSDGRVPWAWLRTAAGYKQLNRTSAAAGYTAVVRPFPVAIVQ